MQPPKIAKVEAHHRTAILLHFTDGSVIELVAIGQELEAQQVVLVALWICCDGRRAPNIARRDQPTPAGPTHPLLIRQAPVTESL